jgi:hypothetical protein
LFGLRPSEYMLKFVPRKLALYHCGSYSVMYSQTESINLVYLPDFSDLYLLCSFLLMIHWNTVIMGRTEY